MRGPDRARRGGEMEDLGLVPDGAVLVEDGRILAAGPTDAVARELKRLPAPTGGHLEERDCRGQVVTPGLVDSHTHLVFPAPRLEDFERRLRGASYEEIAAAGGGIVRTMRQLDAAADEDLVAAATAHIRAAQSWGTTTIEIKSGYGLGPEAELRLLRLAAEAGRAAGARVVLTLLAAHALPPEFRDRRQEFIAIVTGALLPAAVAPAETTRRGGQPTANCDVYCDRGAFTVAEAETVLRAAQKLGLGLKVHAEQLAATGAARLACALGALSADHLEQTTAADHQALGHAPTVATLLPGCDLFLGTAYAPARELIAAGAAVALASDFNPGTSPMLSLPLAMSLACTQMRMTPAEAWTAVTINGAAALALAGETGSLLPGKRADLALFTADDYRAIPYYLGQNLCREVMQAGEWIAPGSPGARG